MAQDTLIILCKTLNDAISASSQIERRHDLNRLFIFLGKKPLEKDLRWMASTDSSLVLERAVEWSDNPELVGIRAGLMFANGWDLIFCWADNCPTNKDIDWVKGQLKSNGLSKMSNIWGITRDHYILQGLGEDNQQFSNTSFQKTDDITNGVLIANALSGKAVDVPSAVAALKEIVILSPLSVHQSAVKANDTLTDLIINSVEFLDENAPVSMLVGNECTEDMLTTLKSKIANHGAIIRIAQNILENPKPYRTINVNDGTKIALYGK